MCCDAEDCKKNFHDSEMNRLIDQYTNSILLNITIPPPPRKKTKVAEEGTMRSREWGGGVGRGKGWSVCVQGWQQIISKSCLSAHFTPFCTLPLTYTPSHSTPSQTLSWKVRLTVLQETNRQAAASLNNSLQKDTQRGTPCSKVRPVRGLRLRP